MLVSSAIRAFFSSPEKGMLGTYPCGSRRAPPDVRPLTSSLIDPHPRVAPLTFSHDFANVEDIHSDPRIGIVGTLASGELPGGMVGLIRAIHFTGASPSQRKLGGGNSPSDKALYYVRRCGAGDRRRDSSHAA